MSDYKRLTCRHRIDVDGTEQVGYTEKVAGCYCKQDMILYRLAELEDKIESGLLVELPCKVGTIVYYVVGGYKRVRLYKKKYTFVIIEIPFELNMLDSYQNNWFLTKESAEARLKELQEGKK